MSRSINLNEVVLDFLRRYVDGKVVTADFLAAGLNSYVFAFQSQGRELVLKLSSDLFAIQKDKLAHDWFGTQVAIPETHAFGRFDGHLYFAIAERAPGQMLEAIDAIEPERFVSQIVHLLSVLRQRPVPAGMGYGICRLDGRADVSSWQAFLNHGDPFDRVLDGDLDQHPLLEREVYATYREQLAALSTFCPEERFLIHGDFKGHNLLCDGDRITGVIDWNRMGYGDFLYDLASLAYQSPQPVKWQYVTALQTACAEANIPLPHFGARMTCYMTRLGLHNLIEFARLNHEAGYKATKAKLATLSRHGSLESAGVKR